MKTLKSLKHFTAAWLVAAMPATAADINIVGSSTVYPFSAAAAELFARAGGGEAPKVESTGTGGGMKLLCGGGGSAPDIANASRRMKKSEQELCLQNGIRNVLEIKIGYDGIVVAQSAQADGSAPSFTRRQLFLGLARDIAKDGAVAANPYKKWSDIDPSLPDAAIRVYGPPPTSGTRDAFVELVMEKGCEHPQMESLSKSDKKAFCHAIREDGAYVEAGENDNLIIQKLSANPDTMGVFGFSFLESNLDKVRGAAVENVAPDFDAIADGDYPVSRPLFFYVNMHNYKDNPSLKAFVEFFVSEEVMGEDGALIDRGLIPLPDDEYQNTVRAAADNIPMENL